MKKITILFLCIFLLALPGCRAEAAQSGGTSEGGFAAEFTDEMIEQMTEQYLNMDIDAMIEMNRQSGKDEETLEKARKQLEVMKKHAENGTLGDYMRGVAVPEDSEETGEDEPDWGDGELELYPAYVA
ncbi:MAG: hypothetical protein FWG09_04445, partial [Synergistaceae bacterium]|nr:hypothetical protein [Synergistaceae bacterium]